MTKYKYNIIRYIYCTLYVHKNLQHLSNGMSLVDQLSIEVDRELSHDGAQSHTALGVGLISLLRLEDEQKMLLFKVLLVGDYRLDSQHGATSLPQWLGVAVGVRCRGDPVVVRNGPDHALETHRVDFDVEVCLASRLDLHVYNIYYVLRTQ